MKKPLILLLASAVVTFGISSCKKSKDDTPAAASVSPVQANINGTTFSASTQIIVPNDSVLFTSDSYDPAIAANGSYLCYTYTFKQGTVPVNVFVLGQSSVKSGDTTSFYLLLESTNAITTGSFPIFGDDNLPKPGTYNTIGSFGYSNTSIDFTDSSITGTINITEFDAVKKVVSGTFELVDTGTKDSDLSTVTVKNGSFTNIPFQKF